MSGWRGICQSGVNITALDISLYGLGWPEIRRPFHILTGHFSMIYLTFASGLSNKKSDKMTFSHRTKPRELKHKGTEIQQCSGLEHWIRLYWSPYLLFIWNSNLDGGLCLETRYRTKLKIRWGKSSSSRAILPPGRFLPQKPRSPGA